MQMSNALLQIKAVVYNAQSIQYFVNSIRSYKFLSLSLETRNGANIEIVLT